MPRSTLRLLSWNIDMDTPPVLTRARALLAKIRGEAPDVVCLQEVTLPVYQLLERALCGPTPDPAKSPATDKSTSTETSPPLRYDMHVNAEWPEVLPYYSLILSRRDRLSNTTCTATRFDNSRMFRGLVRVDADLTACKTPLCVLTSHLESLKGGATQRKEQMEEVAALMRVASDSMGRVTVFAGDTNLREAEVSARLVDKNGRETQNPGNGKGVAEGDGDGDGAPKKKRRKAERKLSDAWLMAGSHAGSKFTWDMGLNDNLEGFGEFKPKARYDRCFLLAPPAAEVSIDKLRLLGKERLPCGKFVSDHWGLFVDIAFESKQ